MNTPGTCFFVFTAQFYQNLESEMEIVNSHHHEIHHPRFVLCRQAIKYGLTNQTQLLQWLQFNWNIRANHNSFEVEHSPWKMMVGRRSIPFEMVPKIQGRIIKLRGCIVPKNCIFRGIFWRGFKELNHHHFGESFTGRGREQKFAKKEGPEESAIGLSNGGVNEPLYVSSK